MTLKQAFFVLIVYLVPTMSVAAPADLATILQPGLQQLFDGKLAPADKTAIIEEARAFQTAYDQGLQQIPNRLQNVKYKQNGAQLVEFRVPSLVPRPGHPANEIIGKIYSPIDGSADCPLAYPATLILHHIADSLKSEEQLASMAAGSKKGVVMLIYLPDYGPRRSGKDTFITNDFRDFQRNTLQALLDTRLAYEILKRQPGVDQKNLKLMGISLGGVLGLISMGIDPVFDHYGMLVGGSDIAHIMSYRKEADPDSETSKALKDITWSLDEARKKVAAYDSLTWAGNVKGKKILFMNSKNDEIIDPVLGVEKIAGILRANGNDVEVRFRDGGHRPDRQTLGIWGLYREVFVPVMDFLGEGQRRTCAY